MNCLKIGKQLHNFPVDSLSAGKTIRQAAVVHGPGFSMYKIETFVNYLHVNVCMCIKMLGKIVGFDRAG